MRYAKAIVAVLVAGLTVLASALSEGGVDAGERVQIAVAVTTAVGVYLVPDVPQWPWMKTAVAMLLAVLNLAATLMLDGFTSADWTNLILAALGVLGVAVATNRPSTTS